jgi:hypothetical protein
VTRRDRTPASRTLEETIQLCRFGAISALLMAGARRVLAALCGYRATPREIIKPSERNCLAVMRVTD